jgi:hypothetical protein
MKQVHFTVTSGEPFKDFDVNEFIVTRSRIDPQSRNQRHFRTIATAGRAAMRFAKTVSGKVTKTTVEEVEADKMRRFR